MSNFDLIVYPEFQVRRDRTGILYLKWCHIIHLSHLTLQVISLFIVNGLYYVIIVDTPCSNLPCLNNGTCKISNSEFTCTCLEGYRGDTCEGLYILFDEYLKALSRALSKNKM